MLNPTAQHFNGSSDSFGRIVLTLAVSLALACSGGGEAALGPASPVDASLDAGVMTDSGGPDASTSGLEVVVHQVIARASQDCIEPTYAQPNGDSLQVTAHSSASEGTLYLATDDDYIPIDASWPTENCEQLAGSFECTVSRPADSDMTGASRFATLTIGASATNGTRFENGSFYSYDLRVIEGELRLPPAFAPDYGARFLSAGETATVVGFHTNQPTATLTFLAHRPDAGTASRARFVIENLDLNPSVEVTAPIVVDDRTQLLVFPRGTHIIEIPEAKRYGVSARFNDANDSSTCVMRGPFRRGDRVDEVLVERTQGSPSVFLEAGQYLAGCSGPGYLSVRGYPDEFYRSCNVMHWYFSVYRDGVRLADLSADQVSATVNGVDLGVEGGLTLTKGAAASVGILLDHSHSVHSSGATESVIEAGGRLLETLPDTTFYSLAGFASESSPASLQLPVTLGKTSFPEYPLAPYQIDSTNPFPASRRFDESYSPYEIPTSESATRLFDAVGGMAERGFWATGGGVPADVALRQKVMLLFTDGDDTASDSTLEYAQQRLEACGVYPISVGFGDQVNQNTIAALGGPVPYFTTDKTDLPALFEAAAEEMNGVYRLRIITPDPVGIGPDSFIRVELDGEVASGFYTPSEFRCD